MYDDDNDILNKNLLVLHTKFPHIGKSVEIFWGHKEFSEYIVGLLSDKRVGRQGFPTDVMDALIALQRLHDRMFPEFSPSKFGWGFGLL